MEPKVGAVAEVKGWSGHSAFEERSVKIIHEEIVQHQGILAVASWGGASTFLSSANLQGSEVCDLLHSNLYLDLKHS